jgi:hypothetical protein
MYYKNYILLENNQCGLCWDLEFDKQGKKTHEDLSKHYHDFVPLDYCIQCKTPKFDQYGFQTHTAEIDKIAKIQNNGKDHKFISGMESQYRKQRKNRWIIRIVAVGLVGIVSTVGATSLIF